MHQEKYIFELLNKYSMDTCSITKVPIGFVHKIFSDPFGEDIDQKKYRGMIGSSLYLTASHPNILISTCLCARFQVNP